MIISTYILRFFLIFPNWNIIITQQEDFNGLTTTQNNMVVMMIKEII